VALEQPAEVEQPQLSARGLIPKQVGEEAGIAVPGSDEVAVRSTITKVEIDPKYDVSHYLADQAEPQNGQFVKLTIEAHTGPSYNSSIDPFTSMRWVDDQGITTDTTMTYPASLCQGSGGLSSAMGPGQNYKGVRVLDVPLRQRNPADVDVRLWLWHE
jgi:hypothetical protein